MPIEFVGDLSIQDAKALTLLGRKYRRILEFGVGGSTQIFAQCQPERLVSVETDPTWIERTKENLNKISHTDWTRPEFVPYDLFKPDVNFDLIFVDGVVNKRLDLAMRTWSKLDVGGSMVFHDTRHFDHFRDAAWVMQTFFGTVRNVSVNQNDSNLTIIEKGPPLVYENWNITEGKPAWAYGVEPMPKGEKLWTLEI